MNIKITINNSDSAKVFLASFFFFNKNNSYYVNSVLSLGKAVFRTFNLTVRVNCNGTRIRDYNKLQENF